MKDIIFYLKIGLKLGFLFFDFIINQLIKIYNINIFNYEKRKIIMFYFYIYYECLNMFCIEILFIYYKIMELKEKFLYSENYFINRI